MLKIKIKELKDFKKEKQLLISSNEQCIEYEEDRIKVYRNKNGIKYDSFIILMEKYQFLMELTRPDIMMELQKEIIFKNYCRILKE